MTARLLAPLLVAAAGLTTLATHQTPAVPSEATAGKPRAARTPEARAARGTPHRTPLPTVRPPRKAKPSPAAAATVGSGASLVAVTMYCQTGNRNAAGNWPSLGTAAGNAWELGTRLHVEGVGVVVIEDRSAPGSTDVDLYGGDDAGCEARAIQWGRRYLDVREAA